MERANSVHELVCKSCPRIFTSTDPLALATVALWLPLLGVNQPAAMQRMANDAGECATAAAAAKSGTLMTLSSWSTTPLEEVANAGGSAGKRWFQLYVYKVKDT